MTSKGKIIILKAKEKLQKIEHLHVPVICEQVQAGTFPMEGQQAEGK